MSLGIDLNSVLVSNSESFYIRVVGDSFEDFEVKNDVLIVDKSLVPQTNQLAIVIQEDSFSNS
jgi:DNA polymerase V